MEYPKAAAILKAIGHPVRLKLVEGIAKYGCHVGKMVDNLGLPQSTVSQHLAALRSAGVVTFEKKGTRACYRLTDPRYMKLLQVLGDLS